MTARRSPDIALLVATLFGGGAERTMLNLAGGFVARGYTTDLLVCDAAGAMRELVPHGVRLVEFRANRPLTVLPELVLYLRRCRPAALVASLTNVSVLAVLGQTLSGVETRVAVREGSPISMQRGIETKLGLRIAHWLAPTLYRRAYVRIAVSEGVAVDLAEDMDLPRESITRIYNPTITPTLRQQALEPIDHPWFEDGEPPVVLAVGRLSEVKDYPTLLRAFAKARATIPMRLLILGEGPERAGLESLASTLGIAEEVAMPGFEANPFAYMARAKVYVLSSVWEGFANVVAEALACGAEVVATDCPFGPGELLDGGRYGRLVPVGDAGALAEAVLAAIRDPIGRADTQWLERFSLEAGVDAYLEALGLPGESPAS